MPRTIVLVVATAAMVVACTAPATEEPSSPTSAQPVTTTAADPTATTSSTAPAGSSTTAPERPDGPTAPDFTVGLGRERTESFTLSDEAKPVYMVFWAEW